MKSERKRRNDRIANMILLGIPLYAGIFYLLTFDYGSTWNALAGERRSAESVIGSPQKNIQLKYWNMPINGALTTDQDANLSIGRDSDGDGMPDGWEREYGLFETIKDGEADADKDGLANYQEYQFGTNPLRKDTDGDKYSDKEEIANGYDPRVAGDAKLDFKIKIDKIGIEAPIIWTNSEQEEMIMEDLRRGVSHYYRSAAPGHQGNMIITGHSSNYIWEKGDYNHIFRNLNDLGEGDIISVYTTQRNGDVMQFSYQVKTKKVTFPDDQHIFEDAQYPLLTLITCWPLGTDYRRLIIKADLVNRDTIPAKLLTFYGESMIPGVI